MKRDTCGGSLKSIMVYEVSNKKRVLGEERGMILSRAPGGVKGDILTRNCLS